MVLTTSSPPWQRRVHDNGAIKDKSKGEHNSNNRSGNSKGKGQSSDKGHSKYQIELVNQATQTDQDLDTLQVRHVLTTAMTAMASALSTLR